MFSFLKKKEDEYKTQKITYPILGLLLGSTVGYYVPIVFLFTKFLSVSAVGGIGGYAGIKQLSVEDNYYMYCVFEKYACFKQKIFNLKDHLFRRHIMSRSDFDINYSYRILYNNINNKEHIISKCYNDLLEYTIINSDENNRLLNLFNYIFYFVCQYLIHIKDIETNKETVELIDLATVNVVSINNNLLNAFDYNEEIFMKIYISLEKITMDDVITKTDYMEKLFNKYDNIDKRIHLFNYEYLKHELPLNIDYTEINKLWYNMFIVFSPYEKLSIFHNINIKIVEEINKVSLINKIAGADDMMPHLIYSLLDTKYKRIYSSFKLLEETYNGDIYNNVFEFLYVKYKSIIRYIIKIVEEREKQNIIKNYVNLLFQNSIKNNIIKNNYNVL